MGLYFGWHDYLLGEPQTIEALYNEGLIQSKPEELQGYGYKNNCVSAVSAYSMAKEIGAKIIAEKFIREIYYDACFSENHNIINFDKSVRSKRIHMENFMNYPAMNLCNDLNLKEVKYYGLSQLGCSGIFGCIEMACNSVRCSDSYKACLCITSERIPENCYYDRPAQRLLHSDAASGCIVSNQKLDYQIIGYASVSNSNLKANMLELMMGFASITKAIFRKCAIHSEDIENFLTPNFWPDFWIRLISFLKGDQRAMNFDNMAKSAHAFSSDFIVNLKKLEDKSLVHTDKYQLAYGYGYGAHLYCLIFKKI